MKNKAFGKYYLFTLFGILIASFYPLYMGVKVVCDMLINGTVLKENYPKYIIPYTPICIGLLIGVLLMPLCFKLCKRFALLAGSAVSTAVFFITEFLFESRVVVKTAETVTTLEDWQMFMCYIPPEGWGEKVTAYKTQTAVEILMGEYNPAFKLHFYVIALLIVFAVLNCVYGFAKTAIYGDKSRVNPLAVQSVATAAFIGMCILACFTAFWRDGNLEVSPLSAILMTVFFVLFGMVGGIYAGSFFMGKTTFLCVVTPAILSSVLTTLMYTGELILLNGHLYVLGKGWVFRSLPIIVLAPFDILVILASGLLTALVFVILNKKKKIA